jgi:hypothetical protein
VGIDLERGLDRLRQHAKPRQAGHRCAVGRPHRRHSCGLGPAGSLCQVRGRKTALLYNLERGELLRMDRRYEDSTNAFLLADIKVKEWEETAKTNPPSSWARWAQR